MTSPLANIEAEELLDVQLTDLSETERLFVMAYMRTRSATRALRETGVERAAATAPQMLKRERVRTVIAALTARRMARLQVTPQKIEEELAKVAFATLGAVMRIQEDGTAYLDLSDADDVTLAGLKSFKCEIEHKPGDDPDNPKAVLRMEAHLWPKVEALGKLAQIHKMISGDTQVAVTVDVADVLRARRRAAAGLPPAEGN